MEKNAEREWRNEIYFKDTFDRVSENKGEEALQSLDDIKNKIWSDGSFSDFSLCCIQYHNSIDMRRACALTQDTKPPITL